MEGGGEGRRKLMIFNKFWGKLVRQKPLLENPDAEVVIKSAAFKKLLFRAYEHGKKQGKEREPRNPLGTSDLFDGLENLFRG